MTFEEFNQLSDQLDAESTRMMDTKGKEYANKHTDRLQNFKETADRCGVTPLQACMVLVVKHQMALEGFIRNQRTFSDESVRSRVVDLITYYKLFLALVLERDESPNNWYTVGAAHNEMGLALDIDGVSKHTTEDEKREYIRGYEEFCKQKGPDVVVIRKAEAYDTLMRNLDKYRGLSGNDIQQARKHVAEGNPNYPSLDLK